MTRWENEAITGLIALILAIPGAIVALATLRVLFARRQLHLRRIHLSATPDLQATIDLNETAYELSARRATDWFQDQYVYLHREISAEQEQWAEESGDFQHSPSYGAQEPPWSTSVPWANHTSFQ
ncbi:hypothetical protein BU26DRAFT_59595 [Trematosphaeria pertusa]|uniref:Uncharacterized protein n=1 Tax=Trematosphaeria pertusa TaxID=390896 RepID=A0A6A6I7P8_9PLEO|nr:uncharacterized protein BU26DRAFT_59595 [Trematosphaeria pertusa]KAF2245982.1 hypothetical protein BU26DRAFT_59595 [Trematosphaeria pertusa]